MGIDIKAIEVAPLYEPFGMLIVPSPHHCTPIGRALLHSSVKTSTWCLHWGGNCSPGSSRLYRLGVSQAQKTKVFEPVTKVREMSARGYALHSVCPIFPFYRVG